MNHYTFSWVLCFHVITVSDSERKRTMFRIFQAFSVCARKSMLRNRLQILTGRPNRIMFSLYLVSLLSRGNRIFEVSGLSHAKQKLFRQTDKFGKTTIAAIMKRNLEDG